MCAVGFSAEGGLLASVGMDDAHTVHVWAWERGALPLALFELCSSALFVLPKLVLGVFTSDTLRWQLTEVVDAVLPPAERERMDAFTAFSLSKARGFTCRRHGGRGMPASAESDRSLR